MVMKKNAMRRNLRQSIVRSLGRYIAIILIIALGAGLFVGLLMTKADMVATGQRFMEQQNMFDLRLMNSYAWDWEHLDAISEMDGDEYATLEKGKYTFAEWSQSLNEEWELTLTCEDEVSVWRITDADNNEGGYKGYISDVVFGLMFPDPVITKWQIAPAYPVKFRFTDTANPDRSFITGPANLKIPDMF